jgi:hypothetical protein
MASVLTPSAEDAVDSNVDHHEVAEDQSS